MAQAPVEAKEHMWSLQEWCWDPYNMLALASDSKGMAAVGKSPVGPGGPAAVQPQLGPAGSLLLDEVNRTASKGRGPAVCQVDGCSTDLSSLKEYHQRYKICEFHLKVNSIIREGKRQRFCQQCGRFHDLTCFDADKRSCRARLQRHNARRRKKTTDSDGTKHQGVKKSNSLTRGKAIREMLRLESSKQRQTSDSTSMENWQESGSTQQGSLETSSRQQLSLKLNSADSYSMPAFSGHGQATRKLSPDDSSSGHELAAQLQNSSFGSEQIHASGFGDVESGTGGAGVQPGSAAPAMFPDLPAPSFAGDTPMETLERLPSDMAFFAPPLQPQSSPMPDYSDLSLAASQMQAPFTGAQEPPAFGVSPAAAEQRRGSAEFLMEEARAMLSFTGQYQAIEYRAEEHFTRMSAKLFKCTPEELPVDLKANLLAMLQCGVNALEGYIRPGCLHLTLHAMMASEAGAQLQGLGVRDLVQHLIAASDHTLWRSDTLLIQWYEEVALVRNGRVLHVLSASGSKGVLPNVARISHLAILSSAPSTIQIWGSNIATAENTVLARSQGQIVGVELLTAEAHVAGASEEAPSMVQVSVPAGQSPGVLHLEVARGALLSGVKPVLVVDDALAAKEINELQSDASGIDVDGFLLNLGRVLDLKKAVRAAKFGSNMPVRPFNAADVVEVAEVARKQLVLAINKGWVGVSRMVLPVAVADARSVRDAVAKLEQLTQGIPLLHLAVRSQSAPLVEMLLEWTSAAGYELRASRPGPHGLTALHLAAVLEDGGKLAMLLTGLCIDGAAAWTQANASGKSPADLAMFMGHESTHKRVFEQLRGTLAASMAADEDGSVEDEFEDSAEEDVEVDPDTGDVCDLDAPQAHARAKQPSAFESTSTLSGETSADIDVGDNAPSAKVAKSSLASRPPLAHGAKAVSLRGSHASSVDSGSITTSTSGSDASSVLGRWPSHGSESGLRKRSVVDGLEGVEYTPEDKGKPAASGAGGYATYYEAACANLKVAPTVFDRTSAIGSAVLIAACGGVTLFLRYCGTVLLD